MNKKLFALVSFLLIASFVLAACVSAQATPVASATPAPTQTARVVTQVVEVTVVAPQATQPPAATEEPVSGSEVQCDAYKIDFTPGTGVSEYSIDAGSPREREIVNLWVEGSKETAYILPRMTVIRSLFQGYGNMWKYPQSCDSENLIVDAVTYAQETTSSNHTGEIYLVHEDGSLTLITSDAFTFDLSEVPEDPTQ